MSLESARLDLCEGLRTYIDFAWEDGLPKAEILEELRAMIEEVEAENDAI